MTVQANIPFAIQAGYNEFSTPNYFDDQGNLIAGIYADVSNEDYHAIPALSSSGLKTFKHSPALYKRKYINPINRLKTVSREVAFVTGELAHGLILEPERTKDLYWYQLNQAQFPNSIKTVEEIKEAITNLGGKPKGTKKEDLIDQLLSLDPQAPVFDVLNELHIKRWVLSKNLPWTNLPKEQAVGALETIDEIKSAIERLGEKPISDLKLALIQQLLSLDPKAQIYDVLNSRFQEQELHKTTEYQSFVSKWVMDSIIYSDAHRARDTVMSHRLASKLFTNGIAELTMIAFDQETQMWVKCKFDWLRLDGIAVDLKTTRSTHPDDWAYQAKDLGYELQDAFYCHVASLLNIKIKAFPFVCVEFAEMDNCEVYEFPPHFRAKAHDDMKKYLKEFRECRESNNWYGYNKQQTATVIDW